STVDVGDPLVKLISPEVDVQLAAKESELVEVDASLAKLRLGPRREELLERRQQIQRLEEWCKIGREDLVGAKEAHAQELIILDQQDRLLVRAPTAGVISTPRMQEKVGDLVTPGLLLCAIENASTTHVEVAIPEEESRHVTAGLPVRLKARSLPFQTFTATVD